MTGQHSLNSGAMQNDLRMLPGQGNYLGEVLRDAGYRMGYFGKWHLYGGNRVRPVPPGPFRYGFDHEFLTNNCTLLYDAKRAYYWDETGQLSHAAHAAGDVSWLTSSVRHHAKSRSDSPTEVVVVELK